MYHELTVFKKLIQIKIWASFISIFASDDNEIIHDMKGTFRDTTAVNMIDFEYDRHTNKKRVRKYMIELKDVSRTFKDKKEIIHAVKDVSFHIERGSVVGLLGENGAGKTTLLRMISTILEPTSGDIFIDSKQIKDDAMEIKRKIGVLFGSETGLYERLTARENLQYFAKLYQISNHEAKVRIENLSKRFGMKDYMDRKLGGFSKGMRQKVAIARTLLHDPDVVLLDEPTTGLDITSANMFRELIHELSKEGKTIIFSSHIMEEVKQLCESIIMIHKGEIVYNGTLQELYDEEETDNLNYIFMSRLVRGDFA